MTIKYLPMTEAPSTISGGFNVTQTLYSVSKKGQLTELSRSDDCTYAGDQKTSLAVDKTIPRIAIKTTRSGNGARESVSYYRMS